MKILMLKPYYTPESVSSSHLSEDMMESYLAEEDITIEIHTPYPTRGVSKEVRKEFIKNKKHEVLENGRLTVHRFPMFREGRNSLLRAFRYTLCIIANTINGLKAKDVDVFTIASTPPINGLMMAVLKKFKGYKIMYNLQDIFPDSLVNTGMTKKGSFLWKIGRWIENMTYRAADVITVISEDFKKNIMEKGVPEEKIEIVYNWVDENKVVNVEREDNPLYDKFGLDRNKFYICYSGNVGYTQNLDMLKTVAKNLKEYEDIEFIIIGEGAYKEKLISELEEENIKNIKLFPFQDYSDISCVFSLGDAGLVMSKKGVGTNSVPSKTWSIMSAERPVLASFDKGSELDSIIESQKCGICVDADDVEAFTGAVIEMYNNKDLLRELGKNGRQFILDNLTKETGTKKNLEIMRRIVNG